MPEIASGEDLYLGRLHEARRIWESCSENGNLTERELSFVSRIYNDISRRFQNIEDFYKSGNFEAANKEAYLVYAWAAVRASPRTNIPFCEIREILEGLLNVGIYNLFSK